MTQFMNPTPLGRNQDGLVLFQIFLNGRYPTAGVGASDGVGFGELVMHQQLANEPHPEIQFCHSPDLTGFQWV